MTGEAPTVTVVVAVSLLSVTVMVQFAVPVVRTIEALVSLTILTVDWLRLAPEHEGKLPVNRPLGVSVVQIVLVPVRNRIGFEFWPTALGDTDMAPAPTVCVPVLPAPSE